MLLRSFISLSENLRSWSAEVPLKKPESEFKYGYSSDYECDSPASAIFVEVGVVELDVQVKSKREA